jgi:primase-polymerase (primpol)-like protein
VLTQENGIVGIDLDHCFNPETSKCEQWAIDIINKMDSYTEVSPSGEGIRIFVKGLLPPGGRKKGYIEMYSSGRYLTITGNSLKVANDY